MRNSWYKSHNVISYKSQYKVSWWNIASLEFWYCIMLLTNGYKPTVHKNVYLHVHIFIYISDGCIPYINSEVKLMIFSYSSLFLKSTNYNLCIAHRNYKNITPFKTINYLTINIKIVIPKMHSLYNRMKILKINWYLSTFIRYILLY